MMRITNPLRILTAWTVTVALAMALGSCGDDEDKNLVIQSVSVAPATVDEGDVVVVEAYVTNRSGSPQDDEVVHFTATPATAGVFSSNSARTNGIGIAAVTFSASNAGSVLIGARAGNNPIIEFASLTIEESEDGGGSGLGSVVLTVSRTLMPADGISTATVDAVILDEVGEPVPNGTVVRFAAGEKFTDVNGDGIWSEHIDELEEDADGDGEWDPFGMIDPVDSTQAGRATATFTAGHVPGLVHIKVTAGSVEQRYVGEITVSLAAINAIHSIVLTPDWQQIQVRGTGGIEWAQILAETFDEYGNPAVQGQQVDFTITAGPGGGETIGGTPVGPVTVITDALGQARVTLNAGSLPGTIRVRARSGSVLSTATQVTIRSGPPAFISCGAEQCNVPSWELIGYNNEIIAAVVDIWGNEVPDSTSVYFGTEQGLIEGAAETQAVPTLRGKAVTSWNSAQPKNDEYVFYWCETEGGTLADTSFFYESGPPRSGSIALQPESVPADGKSTSEVIIEVLDGNGGPVAEGNRVDLRTNFGEIASGATSDGCHSSTLVTYFVSQTLDQDYSYSIPDDGVGAIAVISARSGGTSGFHGIVEIELTTGPANSRFSAIRMDTVVAYGGFIPIEVVIKDYYGNPLGGHNIEITAQFGGTVSESPQYTDRYGVATGFRFTATTDQNVYTAVITMTDLDPAFGGLLLSQHISLIE